MKYFVLLMLLIAMPSIGQHATPFTMGGDDNEDGMIGGVTGDAGVNLFNASTAGGVQGSGNWLVQSPIVVTLGTEDSDGGTDGFTYSTASAAAYKYGTNHPIRMPLHTDGYLGAGKSLCWSICVQNVNTPAGTRIQLYSQSGGAAWILRVDCNFASSGTSKIISTVVASSALTALGGSASYESLGSDWYRVWGTVPIDTAGEWDDWEIRLLPWIASTATDAEIMYCFPQVNPGTEPDTFVPVVVE
jgi:hypothetical protein